MRIIKFRIWDFEHKKMFPFEEAVWTGVHISTPDGREYDVPVFSVAFLDGQHKLAAQQFTGLQDKNGKDIYEGDVLRVTDKTPRKGCRYFQGEYWMEDGSDPMEVRVKHCKVIWSSSGAFWTEYLDWFRTCAGDLDGTPVGGWVEHGAEAEILGNIFEHEELCKQLSSSPNSKS